jgi:undecaprenyl pyrophosphate synthase
VQKKARRQDRDPQHPPDANKEIAKLVKDKAISEDEKRRAEDEIQKLTDKAIKDVDVVEARKRTAVGLKRSIPPSRCPPPATARPATAIIMDGNGRWAQQRRARA